VEGIGFSAHYLYAYRFKIVKKNTAETQSPQKYRRAKIKTKTPPFFCGENPKIIRKKNISFLRTGIDRRR
jgi:hypothetical protein